MKVLGIDPGTKSFDIFGLQDGDICVDTSIATERVTKQPQLLIDILETQVPFDLMVAPSGFGHPIMTLKDVSDQDLFLLTLRHPSHNATMGLQTIIEALKSKPWNMVFVPGVKHLESVPRFRKVNKIDLGTADKVCTAVVAIRDMMDTFQKPCDEINCIVVEIGAAFNAILAIEKGKIIDGIGGSNLMGFQACGALDGELAYLLGEIGKKTIYSGGAKSIIGSDQLSLQEAFLLAQRDSQTQLALDAMFDQLVKGIYSMLASFHQDARPAAIFISARSTYEKNVIDELQYRLKEKIQVRAMKNYGHNTKQAAQGAAFIAEGLMHGKYHSIIENLGIQTAKGHILDDIYLPIPNF
jgi:predicted butyrate kinase (DUF1464 family)